MSDDVRALLVEPFDPSADQAPARALLDIARKRYAELAYERALEALLDAESKARHADPSPTLWPLLTEIHVLMGVIDTARGADAQAVTDFRIARALDPALVLDAAYYPPAVRARFAEANPAAPAHGPGQIEVHDPAGTLVSIDGVLVGRAPLLREVQGGDHYVAVEGPGREPRIERVPVLAGKRSHVAVFLARRPVVDEVRALVGAARRRGGLDREEARRLGTLLGADLVLAVDRSRARAIWTGSVLPGRFPGELPDSPVEARSGPPSLRGLLAALPHQEPNPILLSAPPDTPARPPSPPRPWYGRWWVWTLGGAALVGAAAATAAALSSQTTNYTFPPR
jgi:hypothetical protein